MFSRTYKIIIQIIISLLFLVYIIHRFDLTSLFVAGLTIKTEYYIISFLVVILNSIILAQKYKIVMKPSGIYQSLIRLIKINFICRFYSMFLTTAIGQGVIRWHISTKNQEGRFKFIAVMFFERSTFFFALCLFVGISLFFVPNPGVKEIAGKIYPFIAAGLLVIILYYFYLNYSPFNSLLNEIFSNIKRKNEGVITNKLFSFISIFSMYNKKRKILAAGLCLALVWHFFFLFRVYLLIISIQVPLSFVDLCWMASLVLLLQVLPITFNGIGIRETAYAFFFRMQDLPPEKGVLLGILFFSQMLLMSIIGGVVHLLSKE